MPDTYDYSHLPDAPTIEEGSNSMARLSGLASDQVRAEARVAQAEQELEEAKEALRLISEEQLPSLMEQLRLENFETPDVQISIKSELFGSITKENAAEALAWLEEHGHGGVIKRQFIIDFGKDQEEWADEFDKKVREMRAAEKPLNVAKKRTVAAPTLKALVRTEMEQGNVLPLRLLGIFRKRSSKVRVKT